MAGPAFYDAMKVLPGCDALDQKDAFKFFMGHTHCNVPHPHGKVDTGFMVAGRRCGNYGFPIVDTTEGRVRVWRLRGCVQRRGDDSHTTRRSLVSSKKGWRRQCLDLADTWPDEPIVT